jgi:hypothetical protein
VNSKPSLNQKKSRGQKKFGGKGLLILAGLSNLSQGGKLYMHMMGKWKRSNKIVRKIIKQLFSFFS